VLNEDVRKGEAKAARETAETAGLLCCIFVTGTCVTYFILHPGVICGDVVSAVGNEEEAGC
jgi:hypothetical protein